MRRNPSTAIGIVACGLVIAAGAIAGMTPAGAATAPNPVQSAVQNVENATGAAIGQVTTPVAPGAGPATPAATPSTTPAAAPPANPLAPLATLPLSISVPFTALANEIGSSLLPGQNATTGTNKTTQSSPLVNVNAAVNACSLSVGLLAGAHSSCSTTSVGLNQLGAIGTANVPITAQDNAIGLLGQAAAALGLTTGQSSGSTTQNGAINADAPVSICAVNVGLVGDTSSNCDSTGTNGSTTQKGVIDAAVPVTVCDVIAEIDGNSTANCPQQPNAVSQQGQLADLYAPVTVCGIIAEVYGTATGMCMPSAGFPLVNDLPTNNVSQGAPIDGVVPINACSLVVAVAGSATNSCEPSHLATTPTGSVPVNVPVTVCAVTAALDGNANGSCTGAGSNAIPIGTPGGPGTGVTLPVTICGVEAALGGSANASCPQPSAPTSPPSTSPSGSAGTTPTSVPVSLASTAPAGALTAASAGAPAASKGGGVLATTGAWLLLEVLIGTGTLLVGLVLNRLGRRRTDGTV